MQGTEKVIFCRGQFKVDIFGYVKCHYGHLSVEKNVLLDQVENRLHILEKKVATLEARDNPSVPAFDFDSIDPAVATQLFTAGFLLCVVPWAAFFGIAKLLEAIRQY